MTEDSVAIDRIDREILSVLADEARIGWSELGARVRLSPNAAADRVRRLVRNGVIRRFTAEVDQGRLGRTLDAVIDVRVDGTNRFRQGALACDEVTWLAHVTGRTDFQVHVSCNGTAGLNALLTKFRDELGATETLTTVVLEQVRRTR
jgi:Lrp/AsnC family transcriptional regulator, leucine-responsive regulatory protein